MIQINGADILGSVDFTLDVTDTDAINATVDTALNTEIPASNATDSINDILLDQIKPRLPGSGTITTGAMRGTDNAALASVLGALDSAAAEGAVTDADVAMSYLKQLVTELQALDTVADAIPVTAMRGTDNAALASVLGALDTSGATGAVADNKMAMAYLKQLVTDIEQIYTTALGVSPTDGSLASFISTGGTALGTRLPASKSLYDGLSGGIDAVNRIAGKLQMATTTESLNQGVASYDLLTGTTQAVVLEKLNIKMPTEAAGGALTGISIQTDDVTPGVIISAATGVVANLTSEADLSWTGSLLINVGTKIQLTIAGGAHGSAYVATIIAQSRAVVSGGYLAVSV